MCENKKLLMFPDLYQKITILTSTLVKEYNGYRVNHEFKEIVKENLGGNSSCNIRTNYEKVDISKDLKQREIQLSYDCDRSSHERKDWNPACPKTEKIRQDLPQLYKTIENGRYEIAKRVFES